MRVKPKEIMVNLPVVLTFATEDEVAALASGVNTFIHGKVKVKYELLGTLGGQFIGLFYLQRNNESQELHDDFMRMIEQEEMNDDPWLDEPLTLEEKAAIEAAEAALPQENKKYKPQRYSCSGCDRTFGREDDVLFHYPHCDKMINCK